MRILSCVLSSLLLIACGSSKKGQLLDRTFNNAAAQAVGYLIAARELSQLPDYKELPPPQIEPTQIPGYLPIFADQLPQSWSVSMHYGPGENQITVEGFGESVSQPLQSRVVELSRRHKD